VEREIMKAPQYALVAYVRNPVGYFVERIRERDFPEHGHLPAHLTILPPRYLQGPESQALEEMASLCRDAEPFEVVMGEVETFLPVTPTIFIRVAHGGYRMRELHERLNAGALAAQEQWPYMPHLTIVKLATDAEAEAALPLAQDRWSRFHGTRRILVEQLTFVREGENGRWLDLAPIPLGGRLAGSTR
jgi:2'-5' RNA ligase